MKLILYIVHNFFIKKIQHAEIIKTISTHVSSIWSYLQVICVFELHSSFACPHKKILKLSNSNQALMISIIIDSYWGITHKSLKLLKYKKNYLNVKITESQEQNVKMEKGVGIFQQIVNWRTSKRVDAFMQKLKSHFQAMNRTGRLIIGA